MSCVSYKMFLTESLLSLLTELLDRAIRTPLPSFFWWPSWTLDPRRSTQYLCGAQIHKGLLGTNTEYGGTSSERTAPSPRAPPHCQTRHWSGDWGTRQQLHAGEEVGLRVFAPARQAWLRHTYPCWLFIDRSAVQLPYSFNDVVHCTKDTNHNATQLLAAHAEVRLQEDED